MFRQRRRSRSIFCGLIVVLIAATTGSAHAGTWMVNGANVTSKLLPSAGTVEVEEVGVSKERYMTLASKILGISFEDRCTEVLLVGAKLEPEGKITPGSKAKFSGCKGFLEKEPSPACEPKTEGEKGVIRTKALTGSLGTSELVLVPLEGEILKVYEMSKECPLGAKIPVTGQLALNDGNGILSTEKVSHLIESGNATKISVLGNAASISGSAWLELAGEHKGLTWSGLP
jgi:hypothetical protein